MNPNATLDQISYYAPKYSLYAKDTYGFYGCRMLVEDEFAFEQAARELRAANSNRRTVISFWATRDLWQGHRPDLPCTLSWQFVIENDKLNLIATMRSNDVWLGMVNDVFVNTCAQIMMAKLVGVQVGWYQHQVGDLHIYDKNINAAEEFCASDVGAYDIATPYTDKRITWRGVERLLKAERDVRDGTAEPYVAFVDPFLNFIYQGLKRADN